MTRAQGRILTIVAVAIAFIFLIVAVVAYRHSQSTSKNKSTVQQYTHIDVALKDGKLVGPIFAYTVNQGTGLEFSITSNKVGKVGVPTDPPQTITFTTSPLVFQFKANNKPGNYALSYQADGSKEVIEIAAITIHN